MRTGRRPWGRMMSERQMPFQWQVYEGVARKVLADIRQVFNVEAVEGKRVVAGQSGRDVQKLYRLLCGSSLVVIEQSSKSRATNHGSFSTLRGRARHDQHIAYTLVVPLVVKMGAVFSQRTP